MADLSPTPSRGPKSRSGIGEDYDPVENLTIGLRRSLKRWVMARYNASALMRETILELQRREAEDDEATLAERAKEDEANARRLILEAAAKRSRLAALRASKLEGIRTAEAEVPGT